MRVIGKKATVLENTEKQALKKLKKLSKKGCNISPFVIYYKGLL